MDTNLSKINEVSCNSYMPRIICWMILLLGCTLSYAGQSAQVNSTYSLSDLGTIGNQHTNRVEMCISGWVGGMNIITAGDGGTPVGATGWQVSILGSNGGVLSVQQYWSAMPTLNIAIGLLPTQGVCFRLQHDVATTTDYVEVWDVNGTRISNNSTVWTSETAAGTGIGIGPGGASSVYVAFLRVSSIILPLNSRPPVTADTGNVVEWKFDGNLVDSSGNGHTAVPLQPGGFPYGGPITYIPTPYQNTISVLKSINSTAWSNVVSQRAGAPAQLDCSDSFSMADSSPAVACAWQMLSAPNSPTWSSRTTQKPFLYGTVWGDYNIQLIVTATGTGGLANTTAISTDHFGMVSTDSNGVVVNANPLVDTFFGQQIAFGRNPWGYADYWQQFSKNVRQQYYSDSGWSALQWEKTGQGTVRYHWGGIGAGASSVPGTTLSSGISATALTIILVDASFLDFSGLPGTPSHIILMASKGDATGEEVRICGISGNTLTVCYDGRGQAGIAAQLWPSGTFVAQSRVDGTATKFLTDPVAPICPLGAGRPPGPALYSVGTVDLVAGSATAKGTGTAWNSTLNNKNSYPLNGTYLSVPATTSGTPFIFNAKILTGGALAQATVGSGIITVVAPLFSLIGQNYIATATPCTGSGFQGHVTVVITDTTGSGATARACIVGGQIISYEVIAGGTGYSDNPVISIQPTWVTLARPYPSSADTNTYSYAITLAQRTIVLRSPFQISPSDTSLLEETMWGTTMCESETVCYLNTFYGAGSNSFAYGHDIPPFASSVFSGFPYSVTDSTGWVNQAGGIDFYGESSSWRNFCYRSGLKSGCDAANTIDVNMIKNPWGNPDTGGFGAFIVGGQTLSAVMNSVISGDTTLWPAIRGHAYLGEILVNRLYNGGTPLCNIENTREFAYRFNILVLGAMYDPDLITFRPRWRGDLANMLAFDTACKKSDGSFSSGYNWNNVGSPGGGAGPLTVTTGVSTVTGTGISTNACLGRSVGTGHIAANSSTLFIDSGTIAGSGVDGVFISGTQGGNAIHGTYLFSGSGGSVTISARWPGDTGSITWMSLNTFGGNLGAEAWGESQDDVNLKTAYHCVWNSSTLVTLDRNWEGANSSVIYSVISNIAGFGQQPFFNGINVYRTALLANSTDPALSAYATAYQPITTAIAQFTHDSGIDPIQFGTNYGSIFPSCVPYAVATTSPTFVWRNPACTYGSDPVFGIALGREQNAEVLNAAVQFYASNPTTPNKTWTDNVYGGIWGSIYGYGPLSPDPNTVANNCNLLNCNIASILFGKWPGFFGGYGSISNWPAVRVGGLAPADLQTLNVSFALAAVANSTHVNVTVTDPSGKDTVYSCSISPCTVMADRRQAGTTLIKTDYLSAVPQILSPGRQILFNTN